MYVCVYVWQCNVSLQDAVNGPFFTANATDEDDGLNGMVVFSLETTVISLPFGISSAGAISKQGELDYEDQNEYTVRFICILSEGSYE